MPESWSCRHFTQANPRGQDQGNVPRLLRTVAGTIEEFNTIEVQDIVFQTETTAEGPWCSMTVYFHVPGDE